MYSGGEEHAIVLTNMEADRLHWTDTDKLDRVSRAHAQRHVGVGQNSAAHSSLTKNRKLEVLRWALFANFFRRVHVGFQAIIDLQGSILDMYVKLVKDPM